MNALKKRLTNFNRRSKAYRQSSMDTSGEQVVLARIENVQPKNERPHSCVWI